MPVRPVYRSIFKAAERQLRASLTRNGRWAAYDRDIGGRNILEKVTHFVYDVRPGDPASFILPAGLVPGGEVSGHNELVMAAELLKENGCKNTAAIIQAVRDTGLSEPQTLQFLTDVFAAVPGCEPHCFEALPAVLLSSRPVDIVPNFKIIMGEFEKRAPHAFFALKSLSNKDRCMREAYEFLKRIKDAAPGAVSAAFLCLPKAVEAGYSWDEIEAHFKNIREICGGFTTEALLFLKDSFRRDISLGWYERFFKRVIEMFDKSALDTFAALPAGIKAGSCPEELIETLEEVVELFGPRSPNAVRFVVASLVSKRPIHETMSLLRGAKKLCEESGRTDKVLEAMVVMADKGLLSTLRSIPESLEEEKKRIKGHFDSKNPLHLLLNYMEVLKLTKGPSAKEPSFTEYLKMLELGEKGQMYKRDIPKDQRIEVRGVVYEAYLLWSKIRELEARAKAEGRRVVAVANLSYGGVALSPITEEREGKLFIVGTNVPVIRTKVGSTESHGNEIVINPKLFGEAEMRYFIKHLPDIIVVDGTKSVSDPTRTSPHIPDAHKGYRNYFMAVNEALFGDVKASNFFVDDELKKELQKLSDYRMIVTNILRSGLQPLRPPHPYHLVFWYPGRKGLYMRRHKQKTFIAPKVGDASALHVPSLIFVQSAIEPEAVPQDIKKRFMHGKSHTPAYFDDQDHFREFFMDYRKGYGIVETSKFANLARFYFSELLHMVSATAPAAAEVRPQNLRKVRDVISDLDGVLAATDVPLPDPVNKELCDFLSKGGRFVIVSEDLEENIERRVVQGIPQSLRGGLMVFSDGATKGFGFKADGSKYYMDAYNEKSRISAALRKEILDLLNTHLVGQYRIDNRQNRISIGYRIDLRDVQGPRNDFIARVRQLLAAANIKTKVYKVGTSSVKIVLQHKEDAARYCSVMHNMDFKETLIVGDSARTEEADRALLSSFQDAICVNVGDPAKTIAAANPNIIQVAGEGTNGMYRFLQLLVRYGGFDENMVSPY